MADLHTLSSRVEIQLQSAKQLRRDAGTLVQGLARTRDELADIQQTNSPKEDTSDGRDRDTSN